MCVCEREELLFSRNEPLKDILFHLLGWPLFFATNQPSPPATVRGVVVVVRSDRFRDDCLVSSNTLELLLGNDHVLRIDTLFPGLRHHHHLHV